MKNFRQSLAILALLTISVVVAGCSPTGGGFLVHTPSVTADWETAPGEYVICENFSNTITFKFRMPDRNDLVEVQQIFTGKGANDSYDVTVITQAAQVPFDGNQGTVTHTFAPYTSPLNLESTELDTSAIVIVPNDPEARSGTTLVTYRVVTDTGWIFNYDYELPVWGGCTTS